MAKLPFTFALLFFFSVVALSEPRTPSDLPDDVFNGHGLPANKPGSHSDSEAKSTATILLPSEKPESDSSTLVQFDTEATDSNPRDSDGSATASEDMSEPHKVRVTRVTFRPFDSQFHDRAIPQSFRYPFRRVGHRCRHGHRLFQPFRQHSREISYGDDMILSDSGEKQQQGFDPQSSSQLPSGRWVRVHHKKPRFGYVNVAWKEDGMKKPDGREEHEDDDEEKEHHHHHHFFRHHRHHRSEHHHHDHEDEEKEHGVQGVFKRIRKFLKHF